MHAVAQQSLMHSHKPLFRLQWGRYHSDFVLGSRPYVAAALIGATTASYNVTLYASITATGSVDKIPITAMVMTGGNFTDFQACLSMHLLLALMPALGFEPAISVIGGSLSPMLAPWPCRCLSGSDAVSL